jgi:3-hydroxymyristoyl/3-hydroxydecanoyl-(acyl carrier protein) dehydratase
VLPHRYPFRFLEPSIGDEGVRVVLSGGAWASRGRSLPAFLAVEILAQASLAALAGGASPAAGIFLAGVDDVRFSAPLRPGADLLAQVEVIGRFARLVKIRGRLLERDEVIAEGSLLLAGG